jgi:Dyp-type peroxidase family
MANINIFQLGQSLGNPGYKAFSKKIQGNILKPHGREQAAHIFFSFPTEDKVKGLSDFIAGLLPIITTAFAQELSSQARKAAVSNNAEPVEELFVGLYLSAKAYNDLGWPLPKPFSRSGAADKFFEEGMKNNVESLNDPAVANWEEGFQNDLHGMVLLAYSGDMAVLGSHVEDMENRLDRAGAGIVFTEWGVVMRNRIGDSIEHFGYVDGISHPTFFTTERTTRNWDPLMPLSLVLVKEDTGNSNDDAHGSFLVFRKLEQNVKKFKEAEEELARLLSLSETNSDLAGAMIVGRFENGMPVVLSDKDMVQIPEIEPVVGRINDFNYKADDEGAKCPFHAHIRKVNPRGDTSMGGKEPLRKEMERMIVRRGITYTDKTGRVFDKSKNRFLDEPEIGNGLLFMCFQSSINHQFAFIQNVWASNDNFLLDKTGKDPIIGQGDINPSLHNYPSTYGDESNERQHPNLAFGNFVTMKGGEFFFAPSILFLSLMVEQQVDVSQEEGDTDEVVAHEIQRNQSSGNLTHYSNHFM